MTGFTISNFCARQVDVMLIGRFWGATDTGYYNRAYQLMLLPLNAINGPLASVFVPALSRLQSHPARWRDAFMRAYLMSTTVGCAFACVLMVTGEHVIALVYGPGWLTTVAIFKWLSWSMICTFPMGAMAWAFVSLGNTKAMFHWGVISLAVLASVFGLTVPLGTVAMAMWFCIALWALTPVIFHLALRNSPILPRTALAAILPAWIAAGTAAGIGILIKSRIEFGLLPTILVEAVGTLLAFSTVLVLLVCRSSTWQRMATDVWMLGRHVVVSRTRPA
jgi:PST family polysaccharide transporter